MKLTYSAADDRKFDSAPPEGTQRIRPLEEILRKRVTQPQSDVYVSTGFEAILDAYALDPDRWDGLE